MYFVQVEKWNKHSFWYSIYILYYYIIYIVTLSHFIIIAAAPTITEIR